MVQFNKSQLKLLLQSVILDIERIENNKYFETVHKNSYDYKDKKYLKGKIIEYIFNKGYWKNVLLLYIYYSNYRIMDIILILIINNLKRI